MIYDEVPLPHRPTKSTVRQKRWERCVWVAGNMGKWPSRYGQLTKIRLSDGCGGKTITPAVQFEYDRHGFEGYLGNVG